jgi:uncharacterized protein YdcH (DUF465 family)
MTAAFNRVQQLYNQGLRKQYETPEEAIAFFDKLIDALNKLSEEIPTYRHNLKIVRKEYIDNLQTDLPMADIMYNTLN